jgi:hypothetical protein
MGEIDVAAKHRNRRRGGIISVGLISLRLPRLSQSDRSGRTRARRRGGRRRQRCGPRRRGRRMERRGDRGCCRRSGGSRRRRRDHASPTNGAATRSQLPARWRISAAAAAVARARAPAKTIGARSGGKTGRQLVRSAWGRSGPAGETGPELRGLGVLSASGLPDGDGRAMTKMQIAHASAAKNAYGRAEPRTNENVP